MKRSDIPTTTVLFWVQEMMPCLGSRQKANSTWGRFWMGMFDDVKFMMHCPMCGEEIGGFQSKDGDCSLSRLTPAELAAEGNLRNGVTMYTSCEKCATWTEVKFRRHENWACDCGKPKVLHDKCLECHVGGLACGCRFENGRWISLAEWRAVRTPHPDAYRESGV